MSQLQYIRTRYNVPAFRGMRVRYTGDDDPIEGRIIFARGAHLGVRFDGAPNIRTLHPTWKVEYLHDPAQSPPHEEACAALREDRFSHDCDCGFMDRFAKDPRESVDDDELKEALEQMRARKGSRDGAG